MVRVGSQKTLTNQANSIVLLNVLSHQRVGRNKDFRNCLSDIDLRLDSQLMVLRSGFENRRSQIEQEWDGVIDHKIRDQILVQGDQENNLADHMLNVDADLLAFWDPYFLFLAGLGFEIFGRILVVLRWLWALFWYRKSPIKKAQDIKILHQHSSYLLNHWLGSILICKFLSNLTK